MDYLDAAGHPIVVIKSMYCAGLMLASHVRTHYLMHITKEAFTGTRITCHYFWALKTQGR